METYVIESFAAQIQNRPDDQTAGPIIGTDMPKSVFYSSSKDEVIGQDRGLKQVMKMVNQVSSLSSQVLLLGETGVGKEVIADAIHHASPRAANAFIKVNCGAIPGDLIDSEFFGHERGAFTGAVRKKKGWFERADKGTLFLDEIGELSLQAQVRLLRVLQFKKVERVGNASPVPVDIRVIAATHQNLEKMVEDGRFRKDLWFRLNVFPILIPALRDRKTDIPDLVRFLIQRKTKELGIPAPPYPTRASVEQLIAYAWPGNVRELENIIERALIQNHAAPASTPLNFQIRNVFRFHKTSDANHEIANAVHGIVDAVHGIPDLNLESNMRCLIQKALVASGGKVKGKQGAAALLGINPSTLRYRMNKMGIPFGRSSKASTV